MSSFVNHSHVGSHLSLCKCNDSGWRPVTRRTDHVIRGLGFGQVISVGTFRKGKGARVWIRSLCQWFSQSCICNDPNKNSREQDLGKFLRCEVVAGAMHPNFLGKGHGSSMFTILTDLTLWNSPFGWSWFYNQNLYNQISFIIKTAIGSKYFFEFCLVNSQTWGNCVILEPVGQR